MSARMLKELKSLTPWQWDTAKKANNSIGPKTLQELEQLGSLSTSTAGAKTRRDPHSRDTSTPINTPGSSTNAQTPCTPSDGSIARRKSDSGPDTKTIKRRSSEGTPVDSITKPFKAIKLSTYSTPAASLKQRSRLNEPSPQVTSIITPSMNNTLSAAEAQMGTVTKTPMHAPGAYRQRPSITGAQQKLVLDTPTPSIPAVQTPITTPVIRKSLDVTSTSSNMQVPETQPVQQQPPHNNAATAIVTVVSTPTHPVDIASTSKQQVATENDKASAHTSQPAITTKIPAAVSDVLTVTTHAAGTDDVNDNVHKVSADVPDDHPHEMNVDDAAACLVSMGRSQMEIIAAQPDVAKTGSREQTCADQTSLQEGMRRQNSPSPSANAQNTGPVVTFIAPKPQAVLVDSAQADTTKGLKHATRCTASPRANQPVSVNIAAVIPYQVVAGQAAPQEAVVDAPRVKHCKPVKGGNAEPVCHPVTQPQPHAIQQPLPFPTIKHSRPATSMPALQKDATETTQNGPQKQKLKQSLLPVVPVVEVAFTPQSNAVTASKEQAELWPASLAFVQPSPALSKPAQPVPPVAIQHPNITQPAVGDLSLAPWGPVQCRFTQAVGAYCRTSGMQPTTANVAQVQNVVGLLKDLQPHLVEQVLAQLKQHMQVVAANPKSGNKAQENKQEQLSQQDQRHVQDVVQTNSSNNAITGVQLSIASLNIPVHSAVDSEWCAPLNPHVKALYSLLLGSGKALRDAGMPQNNTINIATVSQPPAIQSALNTILNSTNGNQVAALPFAAGHVNTPSPPLQQQQQQHIVPPPAISVSGHILSPVDTNRAPYVPPVNTKPKVPKPAGRKQQQQQNAGMPGPVAGSSLRIRHAPAQQQHQQQQLQQQKNMHIAPKPQMPMPSQAVCQSTGLFQHGGLVTRPAGQPAAQQPCYVAKQPVALQSVHGSFMLPVSMMQQMQLACGFPGFAPAVDGKGGPQQSMQQQYLQLCYPQLTTHQQHMPQQQGPKPWPMHLA